MPEHDFSEQISGPSRFRTTAWSLVALAQDREHSDYRNSISALCTRYWKPIYRYMRRRGYKHQEAIDLVQEYFAVFLEKGFVESADRDRGKFRTFLLTTVSRFLSKYNRRHARERNMRPISVQMDVDDEEMAIDALADERTPEDEFNLSWARTLIARTLDRMQTFCEEEERMHYYHAFRTYLDIATTSTPPSYRELGQMLGLSETDVTNHLHRGRNLFQKLLRDEIRESVTDEADIDDEIDALRGYLGG